MTDALLAASLIAGGLAALDLVAWAYTTVWSFFFGSTL